jgi:hypothetical protein
MLIHPPHHTHARVIDRADAEPRYTRERILRLRSAGGAAHKISAKRKAMQRKLHEHPAACVNISSLARRLGISMRAAITPQLLACYGQSPESLADQPRWLWDLLDAARQALSEQPPRRQSTAAAELFQVECSTLFPGRLRQESIRCCAALGGDGDGNVMLTFRLTPP